MDFCLLLKTWVRITAINMVKNLVLDSVKTSTADAIKTASKRSIQKTAEASGDFIDNKIAVKIRSVSKKSSKELHSEKLKNDNANNEKEVPNKRYISPKKRQQIIDELTLV